ncbi:MAG: c-type cytochrome [Acidobacteriota bacterium]|nr:c-type cytochrome [Acidobacteriota bacterium]
MKSKWIPIFFLSASVALIAANEGAWMRKVPAKERRRVNPYAGKTEAIAAGRLLFQEHCAQCHGSDARGQHGHPSLRSERIARATDGELAWLLRNGYVSKGMPSWNLLPEPERWQIIAYLRSLPHAAPDTARTTVP